MLRRNGLARAGEYDRELGDMLQLLIIPRPRMGHERPHRLIGEAGDSSVAPNRKDLDEISSEELDVLTATFTQLRDLHRGGAQEKEEVAAKVLLPAHPGKVLIGGRHDPYVGRGAFGPRGRGKQTEEIHLYDGSSKLISWRNRVPPSARVRAPGRSARPVKTPAGAPKRPSSISYEDAPHWSSTNGRSDRVDRSWMVRATSSFLVPSSPKSRTVVEVAVT
jgi:hypothetical protein